MSLERHDWSEQECRNLDNTRYVTEYMDWITPKVYGDVCDIGSGLGYPTLKYAESDKVVSIITNDKFFDEDKTTKHSKIKRLILTTEEFMNTEQSLFDCITSTEHIEHLVPETQTKLLEWVVKHLKKDGLFLGSMPDCEQSGNPYHIKEYTHGQYEEILNNYFKNVEVVVLIPGLLYVWQASN